MRKRICIIGAGASGLPAIKSCLEEDLEPVCYEKTSSFGGLWRYREDDKEGVASVMKSTIINSSKEMSAYSDFPPPEHFANFMHNSRVVEYMELYANKFNLHPYIHYNTEVLQVRFAKGFEFTGRWIVKIQKENEQVEEVFDAVMLCIGHHVYPNLPNFPGIDKFQGKILHTHAYKTPAGFEDKNILVVGIGNSGGDAAVELGRFAKTVYLSTRSGTWVSNRIDDYGRPLDVNEMTRMINLMTAIFPWGYINSVYERKLNMRFNHEDFRLKPKHRVLGQHIMINDDLPNRLQSGTVQIKNNIDHFTETGVVFEDDPKEFPIDVALMATGYHIKFPLISDDVIHVEDNKVSLYKFVFPYELQQPTLAVIGLIQPLGSILPISEMQSRWATKVFKGECKLPSRSAMKADINEKQKFMEKHFSPSPRHTIQINYLDYMDEISVLIGAKPKLFPNLLKDPQLLFCCLFGPAVPYQYRLNGPHTWPGAADAILTAEKRIKAPLCTRTLKQIESQWTGSHWIVTFLMSIVSFFGYIIFNLLKYT